MVKEPSTIQLAYYLPCDKRPNYKVARLIDDDAYLVEMFDFIHKYMELLASNAKKNGKGDSYIPLFTVRLQQKRTSHIPPLELS